MNLTDKEILIVCNWLRELGNRIPHVDERELIKKLEAERNVIFSKMSKQKIIDGMRKDVEEMYKSLDKGENV